METIAGIIADHWRRGWSSIQRGHSTPSSAPYYSLAMKAGVGTVDVSEALGFGSDCSVLAKQHPDGSITLYRDGETKRMWVARGNMRRIAERAIKEQSSVAEEG